VTVVWAAAAVACGTALGYARPAFATVLASTTVAVGVAAGVLWKRAAASALVVALCALALAAAASAALRSAGEDSGLLPSMARKGFVVEACGVVQMSRPRSVQIRAERVELAESAWRTNEPLRVSGRAARGIKPGEHVCAKGELVPPRPGFDEAPLLSADRIGERRTGSLIRLAAADVRERFSDAAQAALPKRQAGLLLGMTDGDTALLDDEIAEDFRTTGLAHIVAVSGYNVAVFLAIVMVLARFLAPRSRWLRVAVAVPSLLFFVFLTGLEPSVLRASVSAGVALAVGATGRRTDALRAVAIAFVVLLLAAPQLLFDIGFQLSFGATIGIVICGEPLTERIAQILRSDARWATAVAGGLGTTVAAQITVAPFLAWHFGRIPGVGAFANVVAIPLGGIVMLGGLATLGAASLVPFLGWAPALMRLPLDAILWSAHAFANVPAASLTVGVATALALTGAVVLFVARTPRTRAGSVAFVVLCSGAALGQARAQTSCEAPNVVALDVGQGSAVLLRMDGHAVIVDTGSDRAHVVDQLHAVGVSALDAIVVTHPHVDHALGSLDILEHLEVGRLMGPATLHWASGADVIRAAERTGVPFTPIAAGDVADLGPIHLETLLPEAGDPPPFDEDLIDRYSLVVRASLGPTTVLLPGDIRAEEQRRLASDGVTASVLVAPHHGSKNFDPSFAETVGQRLTLITVGAPNPYGLPAPEAVRAYGEAGPVFRTDQDGRVLVCLTQEGAEVTTQK
jgi:competence protein ComEC